MKTQNGNALFFILIAIALLGLLTMTMTRSGSNTNDTGDFEQAQITANEILAYAKNIENAVQMLLSRGCSENEISFENPVVAGYTNANSPADNSCHVFEPEGAGLRWISANARNLDNTHSGETHYGDWLITSNVHVNGFGNEAPGVPACGISCSELMISLNFIQLGLCNGINQVTNHGKSDGTPILDTGNSIGHSAHAKFTGGYLASTEMGSATPATDNYNGKPSGCIQTENAPASGSYTFYHVFHAR